MPWVDYAPKDCVSAEVTVYGEDVPAGIASDNGAWIRRYGGDPTRFARDGELFDEAIFTSIQIPMSAITEVFGFGVLAEWRKSGEDATDAISIQVSLDDGVTFLAWVGGDWVEVDIDEDYNDLGTFNDQCHLLAFSNPRSLGFRVKLVKDADADDSPLLKTMRAYVEWSYDAHLDVLQTIRDLFETGYRTPVTARFKLPADGTTVTVGTEYTVDNTKPITVFNTTEDPNKNIDLFSAFNPATRVVTMLAEQEAGAIIEVSYQGSCEVIIARKDEMVYTSKLPVTTINLNVINDVTNRSGGELWDFKLGTDTKLARRRVHPVARVIEVEAEHWTSDPRAAVRAREPLVRTLSSRFRMQATGETPALLERTPGRLGDVPTESFFMAAWSGQLRLYFHEQGYTEEKLVTKIRVVPGSLQTVWDADPFAVEQA